MMHRQDKTAISFCLMSAAMGFGRPWVPEGWPVVMYHVVWMVPVFWFAPKIWKQLAPPCGVRQWWKMRRLGYSWDLRSQFCSGDRQRYVSHEDGNWFWHHWTEIGTDAYEATGGPTIDPVGAHVLGCVQNWGEN